MRKGKNPLDLSLLRLRRSRLLRSISAARSMLFVFRTPLPLFRRIALCLYQFGCTLRIGLGDMQHRLSGCSGFHIMIPHIRPVKLFSDSSDFVRRSNHLYHFAVFAPDRFLDDLDFNFPFALVNTLHFGFQCADLPVKIRKNNAAVMVSLIRLKSFPLNGIRLCPDMNLRRFVNALFLVAAMIDTGMLIILLLLFVILLSRL